MPKEDIDPILIEEYKIKLENMICFMGLRWVLYEIGCIFRKIWNQNPDSPDWYIPKAISDLMESLCVLLYAAEREDGDDEHGETGDDTEDTEDA